jgi:hypothetical protein
MHPEPIPQLTEKQEESFWSRVEVPYQPSCCWEWTGPKNKDGYGRSTYWIGYKNVARMAHRLAYTLLIGEIPDGLTLDHLCRNRCCVNPDHLQPATLKVNTLRGQTIPARHAKKTHCIHGHEFNFENTYVNRLGHRVCRVCVRWRVANTMSLTFDTSSVMVAGSTFGVDSGGN